MKKLLLSLFILFFISTFSFTQEHKLFGIAPGINVGILGIAPDITLHYSNLELDSRFYISNYNEHNKFGFAPLFSFGYNTKPFEKGYQNFFGVSYILLSDSWLDSFFDFPKNVAQKGNINLHLTGFTYKGAIQWHSGANLNFGFTFPLALFVTYPKSTSSLTVFNGIEGLGACFLSSLATLNVGFNYLF